MWGEDYDVKDVTFAGITVVFSGSLTSQRLVRKKSKQLDFFLPILGRTKKAPFYEELFWCGEKTMTSKMYFRNKFLDF